MPSLSYLHCHLLEFILGEYWNFRSVTNVSTFHICIVSYSVPEEFFEFTDVSIWPFKPLLSFPFSNYSQVSDALSFFFLLDILMQKSLPIYSKVLFCLSVNCFLGHASFNLLSSLFFLVFVLLKCKWSWLGTYFWIKCHVSMSTLPILPYSRER